MLDHECGYDDGECGHGFELGTEMLDGVLNDWGWDVESVLSSRDDAAEHGRAIDEALRAIASKRGQLDAEEARWLREAEDIRIWEQFGYASMLAYMEAVLGHEPRAARDRLRVAREIVKLPLLEVALASSQLSYSAIRELTRVATPETERAWLDDCRGKNASEIHQRVVGRRKGDRPGDRITPELVIQRIGFDVRPEAVARLRETRAAIDDEVGHRVDDTELIMFLCEAILSPGDRDGRAKFQIALTVCAQCKAGTQDGAGIVVPVIASTVARAECDAQRIGSIDPDTGTPARATQDIPPATARFVMRRDHARCCAPGCRSARHLEIHHIVPREDGGSHHHSNLTVLCDLCRARHKSHYAGRVIMPGRAATSTVMRSLYPA